MSAFLCDGLLLENRPQVVHGRQLRSNGRDEVGGTLKQATAESQGASGDAELKLSPVIVKQHDLAGNPDLIW